MGYREFVLDLPTDYYETQLRLSIQKQVRNAGPVLSWQIVKKSLDARRKDDIHWDVRVGVTSAAYGSSLK